MHPSLVTVIELKIMGKRRKTNRPESSLTEDSGRKNIVRQCYSASFSF